MFRASSCPSSGEEYEANSAYGVHTGRAAADSRRRGGSVRTEPPLLLESILLHLFTFMIQDGRSHENKK
jgi:hypothetical protein